MANFRITMCATVLLGLAGMPALAMAEPPASEIGYQEGALGFAALTSGDFQRAEKQLNSLNGVEADDPARLINLGQVYAKTGRYQEAMGAYMAAMHSKKQFDVVLADGRVISSREAAKLALANLRNNYAAR